MDTPLRYSDVVPEEDRKYWYFTTHGIGPGTIPKDLSVLKVIEGKNKKGTLGDFICLNGVVNTSELKEFGLKEEVPDEEYFIYDILNSISGVEDYYYDPTEKTIEVTIDGDWKHSHAHCEYELSQLGYFVKSKKEYPSDDDWYKADYIFKKK